MIVHHDFTSCTVPNAYDAFWNKPVRLLRKELGTSTLPFRRLRIIASRIVGRGIALDLVCAADLRGDVLRVDGGYVRTNARQRKARLRELRDSVFDVPESGDVEVYRQDAFDTAFVNVAIGIDAGEPVEGES